MSESIGGLHRRRRTRTLVVAGVVVLAIGGAAAAARGFGGNDDGDKARDTLPPGTAKVTRTTLTETVTVDGMLGYGSPVTVEAQGTGRLTWLPAPGAVIERGKALYRVDDKPVVLLYGAMPMYQTLAPGVEGNDVKQFEQNLAALGYKGFTVDDTYTSATATAVKAWQKDLGLTQSGSVDPGAVVFAGSAVRVVENTAHLGAAAAGAVLTYSGTARQVTVSLAIAKRSLVSQGAIATVKLPDATTVDGTVSSIATTATTSGEGQSQTTTIDVVVSVADQSKLGSLDQTPVDVTFVASQHKDVLTVPIAALLALAEGGYGVQVVEGTTTRVVAVKTGMFASGRVEVSGEGITTDTVVGVPS